MRSPKCSEEHLCRAALDSSCTLSMLHTIADISSVFCFIPAAWSMSVMFRCALHAKTLWVPLPHAKMQFGGRTAANDENSHYTEKDFFHSSYISFRFSKSNRFWWLRISFFFSSGQAAVHNIVFIKPYWRFRLIADERCNAFLGGAVKNPSGPNPHFFIRL